MTILTQSQLDCLSSTLRTEIVEALNARSEGSISDIARSLGKRTSALYYHFGRLEESGLIVVSSSRRANTQVEAIYRTTDRAFGIDKRNRSPEYRRALVKACQRAMSVAQKEFQHAQSEMNELDQSQLLRATIGLSETDAAELRRRLAELGSWARSRSRPDQPKHSITAVFTPVLEPSSREIKESNS